MVNGTEPTWTVALDGQPWSRGLILDDAAKTGARMEFHFPERKVLIVCDQEPEREMSVLDAWVLAGDGART